MDNGRRTTSLLSYLEKIRIRAERDVSLGVTPAALRANAEERRSRANRRRRQRTAEKENVFRNGHISDTVAEGIVSPKSSSPMKLEDLMNSGIEIVDCPEEKLSENLAPTCEEIRPPMAVTRPFLPGGGARAGGRRSDLGKWAEGLGALSKTTRSVDPSPGWAGVQPAAISAAVLLEWQDTVRELYALVREAEAAGVSDDELEELHQLASVDLEDMLIVPLVNNLLGGLMEAEAQRLYGKLALPTTAAVESSALNLTDSSVASST
ncbi:hypothetical protein FOL47_006316, partial [Perkinsus chesapeaki]